MVTTLCYVVCSLVLKLVAVGGARRRLQCVWAGLALCEDIHAGSLLSNQVRGQLQLFHTLQVSGLALGHELALCLSKDRGFSFTLSHAFEGFDIAEVRVNGLVHWLSNNLHDLELALGGGARHWLNRVRFSIVGRILALHMVRQTQFRASVHETGHTGSRWTLACG